MHAGLTVWWFQNNVINNITYMLNQDRYSELPYEYIQGEYFTCVQ